MKREALPYLEHVERGGRRVYVDMYIEKYGTGELRDDYERILEVYFDTTDKKTMLRKALNSRKVPIICPVTGKIELIDVESGEFIRRMASDLREITSKMKFERDDGGYADVSCRVRGDGLWSLLKILRHMQSVGGVGHSYSIELDPDDSEYSMSVGWDGDGCDHVKDIKVNGKVLNKDQFDKEHMASLRRRVRLIAHRVARKILKENNYFLFEF